MPDIELANSPGKVQSSQHIVDELTAICNSMGKLDENDGTYMKDRDCKPCLKEIQRYLNADSKHHTARITLGSYNIIKCDLIPLLVQYCDFNDGDPELFNTILRLLTNLTSSVLLLFNNIEDIDDKIEHKKLESKILHGLYGYKDAFGESDEVWSTLNTHLRHNRDEDVTLERLIILIRNILHIPVDSSPDNFNEFDAHDMCLYRIDKSGMLSTIIELASDSQKGSEYCFHLMEIIYLILRDQNPEAIAKAQASVLRTTLDEEDVDKKRLEELSARNRKERELKNRQLKHMRFNNSSFVVKNIRSISDRPLILNKPLVASRDDISFDRGKTQLRLSKNKKPLPSTTSMQFSDTNAKTTRYSYSLKIFCEQFIKNNYNNYMNQIKHNLIQKKTQDNDETYYLWAIQFFTAFACHNKSSVDHIAETLSTSTLHFIQVLIISYQEKIKLEKKEYQDISKRLHLALRAYREILILMQQNDSEFSEKIMAIKKNIFRENDYMDLFLNLFQQYDEPKHSKHYLEDLIQTNYIFMQLVSEESTGQAFVYKYANPDVVKAHAHALKKFRSNSAKTNLAIRSLFERLLDMESYVVLLQASLFKTLFEIIEYGDEKFEQLTIKMISKFGRMANKKRWMFQELLFWKAPNDVIEIENAIDPPPALVPEPSSPAINENAEPKDADGDSIMLGGVGADENAIDDINELRDLLESQPVEGGQGGAPDLFGDSDVDERAENEDAKGNENENEVNELKGLLEDDDDDLDLPQSVPNESLKEGSESEDELLESEKARRPIIEDSESSNDIILSEKVARRPMIESDSSNEAVSQTDDDKNKADDGSLPAS